METPNNEYEYAGKRILQTYSGKEVDPLSMSVGDICLDDIAHALSLTCRYNGHIQEFYSVAQHSVLVSHCTQARLLSGVETLEEARNLTMWALLHDAAEAYLGDVIAPLKPSAYFCTDVEDGVLVMTPYKKVEIALERVIAEKFDLSPEMPPIVKKADVAVLLGECESFKHTHGWDTDVEPYGAPITPLPPKEAEELFLYQYMMLRGFYGKEK